MDLEIIDDSEYQEFRIDETPTSYRWQLTKLYKYSATGSLMEWQVRYDGEGNLELYHGYCDGVIRCDRTSIEINQSGRSLEEQALIAARQRYKLKLREGYLPAGSQETRLTKAMKGDKFELKYVTRWPVIVQPKLDGIRMLCTRKSPEDVTMMSNGNKEFTHLYHLREEIVKFFEYLPGGATIDGELYRHGMGFQVLTSAVRTVKTVHPKLEDVQYHIFDINYVDPDGTPYEKRYRLLVQAVMRYVEDHGRPQKLAIVQSKAAKDYDELKQHFSEYIQQGYEGMMIKKISNGAPPGSDDFKSSLYVQKRSRNIMKMKNFIDEEAIIRDVEDCHGTESGAGVLLVLDKRGNIFRVRPRGSFEMRKKWLQNPETVIGKEVTIRYQELSDDGVPRFPIAVSIRDYE